MTGCNCSRSYEGRYSGKKAIFTSLIFPPDKGTYMYAKELSSAHACNFVKLLTQPEYICILCFQKQEVYYATKADRSGDLGKPSLKNCWICKLIFEG